MKQKILFSEERLNGSNKCLIRLPIKKMAENGREVINTTEYSKLKKQTKKLKVWSKINNNKARHITVKV